MNHSPATTLGKGIGDALGAPFEQPGSATEPPERLIGWNGEFLDTHGAYGEFKAGQWTDDTGMAVALGEALLEGKGFDPKIVMQRYDRWYETVPNKLVGGTIKKALESYRLGWLGASKCGVEGSQGNGTAMRCAPIGLFYSANIDLAMNMAREDAKLTHRSIEAEEGSAAVAGAVAYFVPRQDRESLIPSLILLMKHSKIRLALADLQAEFSTAFPFTFVSGKATAERLRDLLKKIGTKGHVLQTVPAAFACFLFTGSFEEAILAAIRAGGDADTTAAITGAIAGTFYGYEGIPERLKVGVDRGDYLHSLDLQLLNG